VPLKPTIVNESDEPIKVFTDVPGALASLKDARFQVVTEASDAKIFWLLSP